MFNVNSWYNYFYNSNILDIFFFFYRTSSIIRSQVFDHVYPGTESNNNSLVVYADFTDVNFQSIHQNIIAKVEEYDLKYILRHAYEVNTRIAIIIILIGIMVSEEVARYC